MRSIIHWERILNCIYHFIRGIQPIEKQQQYLDLMEDGIKRIQKAVTNLLEYARNPNLERSEADFRVLIEKALNLLDYQIRKNQIKIEQDFPETIPPLKVERNQMSQVLVNVFLNAIQAMQDGGMLKVTSQTTDGRLILIISEIGGGVREEDIPKVFDPFFTTKADDGGTGLGLWLSQGVIERHGGAIQIKSRKNEGTTGEIQLPPI